MKSSPNRDHAKVKYRGQPRVENVAKPDRKRIKISDPSRFLGDETNAVVARPLSETAACPETRDNEPEGPETGLGKAGNLNYPNEDKVHSDMSLNVKRKRFSKGISNFQDNKNETRAKDILDDELLQSPVVESIDSISTNERVESQQVKDVDMSSQDLFASPITNSLVDRPQSSNPNSSQVTLSQNSGSDLFSNFFDDEDDLKLAEFDMSGIISSYNSTCIEIKDQESQLGTCSQVDVKMHKETPKLLQQEESNSSIPVMNMACSTMQQVGSDVKPVDENKPLNPGNVDTIHISNAVKSECEAKDASEGLFYGLPPHVGSLIKKHKGIEKLYDWQNDCLNLPAVKNRKNLIYSLPTSGGKTLVAEILIIKELLCHEKDALLILPFVSIVQEKVRDMSLFAVDLGFLVEEYAASKGKFPPRKRRKKKTLYIATIEKANGLVNSLIEENRLLEIGLAVIDEMHMLGEGGHRGATLEMCLAKILFCSSGSQIIGMSATLNNIEDLQLFLNAEVYINDFRPVELKEFIKIENEIYEIKNDRIGRNEEIPLKRSRKVKHKSSDQNLVKNDPDHLSLLVQEVIPEYSCLVFCPTKKNCENVAKLLAETLRRTLKNVKVPEKRELLRSLRSNADRICPVLRKVIPFGIAYHHGGLTMDERKLIEEAYSQGTLCVLTCTSTLAAGVNLPAKRVILRSPYVGKNMIARSQYKQMIGRAGRAGIDTSGESIMLINTKDKEKVMGLINAPLESCYSSLLHDNGQGLRSLVLSIIGLKVCNSIEEINRFTSKTLFAVQNNNEENSSLLENVCENVDAMVKLKLVDKDDSTVDGTTITRVKTTPLGRATFKGCVDVDRSPFIYDEVKRAQENLVLTNDLHLLYLVTTPDMITDITPDLMTYVNQVSRLNSVEKKACDFIGVPEAYLAKLISCNRSLKKGPETLVLKRFYLTLMLYKIINEHSIWDVAETFQQPRGFIQSLFTSSTSFAFCLVQFASELPEFQNIKLLLETVVDKLSFTAVLELVPLMQIPGVKKNRARQLYAAGYRNLRAVANASPEALVNEIEHLPKTQAKLLVSSAKMLLLEKAEALQEEAAELMES